MGRRGQSTTADAADRAVKATVSRHIHLVWPFAAWLGLWPIGGIGYLAWGRGDRAGLPWVVIIMTLLSTFLVWFVWLISSKRHHRGPVDVGHSTITTALAALFLVSATIASPTSHPLVDLWALLGAATATSWALRHVLEKRDKQAHEDGRPSRRGAAAALMAAHGLDDVDAKVIERTPDRLDLAIDTTDTDGLLPEDVAAQRRHMAATLGVPASAVTVIEDPDNAARATMRIVRRDVLRTAIPWPGPSRPGASVFDPLDQGVYLDAVVAAKVVADASGVRHQLTTGMSGSGKGGGARVEVAELITRRHVFPIVLDTVKRTQTFGPLAAALGLFITDTPTARAFVRRLRVVVADRTEYLGAKGLDAWQPGCGLSFLLIQVEEASELDVNEREAEALAKAARSAGIRLVWSLQRSSHTQMSTVLRGQLGSAQVYGCSDDFGDDALPDAVKAAGADPGRWRDEYPGCNYLAAKGIPLERQATPLRDYNITREQMEAHAAAWAPRMEPLDPITAKALGDLWAKRVHPLEVVRQAKAAAGLVIDAPATQTPTGPTSAPATASAPAPREDDEMDAPTELEQITDEELGVTTPAPDVDEHTNPHEPLAQLERNVPFGSTHLQAVRGPMTEEETAAARAMVAERIRAAEDRGVREITPADFAELYNAEDAIRSRSWYRKELQRLVRAGRLTFDAEAKTYTIERDPNAIAV